MYKWKVWKPDNLQELEIRMDILKAKNDMLIKLKVNQYVLGLPQGMFDLYINDHSLIRSYNEWITLIETKVVT